MERPYKAYFLLGDRLGEVCCVVARQRSRKKGYTIQRTIRLEDFYPSPAHTHMHIQRMQSELLKAFKAGASWGRGHFH